MNNLTWILVADGCNARIFSTHKASLFNGDGKTLSIVHTDNHPDSRKADHELVSDKQGRFGKATLAEKSDPHKHEEDVFSMKLAKKLEKDFGENHYHDLILIAPPAFMGMLKKHLTKSVSKIISLTVEKEYTRYEPSEIVKRLQEFL